MTVVEAALDADRNVKGHTMKVIRDEGEESRCKRCLKWEISRLNTSSSPSRAPAHSTGYERMEKTLFFRSRHAERLAAGGAVCFEIDRVAVKKVLSSKKVVAFVELWDIKSTGSSRHAY